MAKPRTLDELANQQAYSLLGWKNAAEQAARENGDYENLRQTLWTKWDTTEKNIVSRGGPLNPEELKKQIEDALSQDVEYKDAVLRFATLKNKIAKGAERGAYRDNVNSAVLEPEQHKAASTGSIPWRLNTDQAVSQMIERDLLPDEIMTMRNWDGRNIDTLPPKLRDMLKSKLAIERVGPPDKNEWSLLGLGAKALRFPDVVFSAGLSELSRTVPNQARLPSETNAPDFSKLKDAPAHIWEAIKGSGNTPYDLSSNLLMQLEGYRQKYKEETGTDPRALAYEAWKKSNTPTPAAQMNQVTLAGLKTDVVSPTYREPSPDELETLADEEVFKKYPEANQFILRHPYITQFAAEFWSPGASFVSDALQFARKLKPVKAVTDKATDIAMYLPDKAGVTYMPELRKVARSSPQADEAASILRIEPNVAAYEVHKHQEAIIPLLDKIDTLAPDEWSKSTIVTAFEAAQAPKIEGAVKKAGFTSLKEAQDILGANRVLETGSTEVHLPDPRLAALDEDTLEFLRKYDSTADGEMAKALVASNPNLQEAYKLMEEASTKHNELRKAAGKGKEFSGETGEVLPPREIEGNYMPHIIEDPEAKIIREAKAKEPDTYQADIPVGEVKSMRSTSDFKRSGKRVPLKDFTAQTRKELLDMTSSTVGARTLKNIDQVLKERDQLFVLQGGKEGHKSRDVADRLEALSKHTGTQWQMMPNTKKLPLASVYLRITGKEGFNEASDIVIAPKDFITNIERVAKIAAPEELGHTLKGLHEIAKDLRDIARPYNRAWSKWQTLPFPKFAEMQYMGNGMLSFIGLGGKSLDVRHQGKAFLIGMAETHGKPELVKSLTYTLKNGQKIRGDEVIEIARMAGISGLEDLWKELRTPTSATGVKGAAVKTGEALETAVDTAVKYAPYPTAKTAQTADTWLKYSILLDRLEGTTLPDIARAADATNEIVLNYNRLGVFEKAVIKDVVPFYTWIRHIGPAAIQALVNHPDRFAKIIDAQSALENNYGRQAPYMAEGVAPWLQNRSVTAPYDMQPPALQAYLRAGKPPEDSHEFAMLVADYPTAFIIPIVEKMFGKDDASMKKNFFPVAQALLEMWTGQDEKGRTIERIPDLRGIDTSTDVGEVQQDQKLMASVPGRFVDAFVGRHLEVVSNVRRLFADNLDAQMRFALGIKAGNDLGMLGKIGEMAYDAVTGQPYEERIKAKFGAKTYLNSPDTNSNWDRSRGWKSSEEWQKIYENAIPE